MTSRLLRHPLTPIVALTLLWVIGLELVTYLAGRIIPSPLNQGNLLVDQWFAWDAGYYERIAAEGYHHFDELSSIKGLYLRTAFFPAFPLLGAVLHGAIGWLGIGLRESLLLLNIGFTVGTTVLLYKLAYAFRRDRRYARRTVEYFLFFPFAFFMIAAYSEAVFTFFMTGFLYALYKERYGWAALLGIGVTGGRFIGVIAPAIMLLGYLEHRQWNLRSLNPRIVLLSATTLLGLGGYMAYQARVFGDPLYYLKASVEGWPRHFEPNLFNVFRELPNHVGTVNGLHYDIIVTTLVFLVFTALSIVALRKISVTFGVVSLLIVFIPLLSGVLIGMNRYVIPSIPVWLVIGLASRNAAFDSAYRYLGALLLALFAILFTHGIWAG